MKHIFSSRIREAKRLLQPAVVPNLTLRLQEPALFDSASRGTEPVNDETFVTRSFGNAAGRREYKLYVPKRRNGSSPLIVMLHGCTQSADDFARGTGMNVIAESHGALVAYPVQPTSANSSKCWNWFLRNDQQRDRGEPSLVVGIIRQIGRDYSVDPRRIYVAGLSAGGAAAAVLAANYPDVFAAVGVHSGLACGAAHDLVSAFAAMRGASVERGTRRSRTPTIVFVGDRDATVHPANSAHIVAATNASEFAVASETGRVAGGHAYTRITYRDPSGRAMHELWTVHGARHAWSGGNPAGSYTDPAGPDASRAMMQFFLSHRRQELAA